jgi:beta-1,4-mannosyl-glycoprotein beta-1,4-N-acetylglucosaminyltransferase
MAVWSLTPLFNELDILEIRLAELDPIVDVHVISESQLTYSGDRKPLHLTECLGDARWNPWRSKMRVVVPYVPEGKDEGRGRPFEPHEGLRWRRENYQRDGLIVGCSGLADEDLVLLSDIDEIPSASVVRDMDIHLGAGEIRRVHLPQHVMYLDWRWTSPSTIAICRFTDGETLKRMGPQAVRLHERGTPSVDYHGWHFSYMGGAEMIRHKIVSAAHSELDRPEWTDLDRIEERLERGIDMFDRRKPLVRVELDRLPVHVRENEDRFDHLLARRDP